MLCRAAWRAGGGRPSVAATAAAAVGRSKGGLIKVVKPSARGIGANLRPLSVSLSTLPLGTRPTNQTNQGGAAAGASGGGGGGGGGVTGPTGFGVNDVSSSAR